MKKYFIWILTEYKRAVARLPLAVKRAVICVIGLVAVAYMIVFCTLKIAGSGETGIAKITVGYVADDDMWTNLALSYVENMESVQYICNLERCDSETEGLAMLEKGEISALVVLPPDVLREIISGSNAHGQLYLPEKNLDIDTGSGLGNVAVMLFEELKNAGIGMLGIAQAEIYATSSLLGQVDDIESLYDDIDRFNLGQVTLREKLFSYKSLSLTGNDTYVVYYTSALLTIYVMLAVFFWGEYSKRGIMEEVYGKRRIGIGYFGQIMSKVVAGTLFGLVIAIIPIVLLFAPGVRGLISVNITYGGIMAFLMVVIFMSALNVLVFEVAENRQAAVVIIGINAILQAYMSGCIIPDILLPVKISQIGQYAPASYIKKAFRMLITGKKGDLQFVVKGLLVWSVAVMALTVIAVRLKEGLPPKTNKEVSYGKAGRIHIPSLSMVVFRRFVHKKSIWVCLMAITVASVLIVRTEKTSDTNIYVAFYDESGEYEDVLNDYVGLVRFVSYGSEDEVKRAVLKDEAECGYVIPGNITTDMLSQMANGAVTVYRDDDTIAVPIVNEVIFEKIFKNVTLKWYGDYIARIDENAASFVEDAFEEKLDGDITFNIDIKRIGDGAKPYETEDTSNGTYPVWAVVILVVVICGIYGIIQVASDIGKNRFYRCRKLPIYLFTVAIPLLFGMVAGLVIIAIITNMGQYSY